MTNEKLAIKIGWCASIMAFLMYFSFIDQIHLNLAGHKGSVLLPLAATLNCGSWTLYGFLKEKKDWPIISCNSVGIVLSILTAITALI